MAFRCMSRLFSLALLACCGWRGPAQLSAGDWPMWRYDAGRSAASPDDLPDQLQLAWTRHFSQRVPVWDDPLNRDMMPYDSLFEPIIADGRMFIGFNDSDKVVALDLQTGRTLWTFFCDGPVRLPPVAWNGSVYFASDDGRLYCVRADDGRERWRFRGGPSDRKVLGNRRVISMWPARGGPVIRDGKIYFAASIWPFLGTFLYALDAETGDVHWVNDHTGSQYIKQPHSAPAFAGVAPQGALVATRDTLLVPGGRSVPAAFDRSTGELLYFHINAGGKGTGGSLVIANDTEFYVHTRRREVRRFDLQSGVKDALMLNEPVLSGDRVFSATDEFVRALDAGKNELWKVPADGSGDLIRAGGRLYAAGNGAITAVELPDGTTPLRVAWSLPVDGKVGRLLAGGDRLLAVTEDGRIHAFERSSNDPPHTIAYSPTPLSPHDGHVEEARALLDSAGQSEGYALWFGVDDGQLLEAALGQSDLHIVAVEPNADRVATLRRRLDDAGLYGRRVAVHQGDPLSFVAPPFIAHLVVVGESVASRYAAADQLAAMYRSVRPYGGVLYVPLAGDDGDQLASSAQTAGLSQLKINRKGGHTLLVREGALPGSAPWTHQYGDIANTVKSDDELVKLPLGILWFGGNSNMDVLPRHGHGPPEQVLNGRLFLQGINSLSARDVYTGRVLWKRTFDDLGTYNVFYDDTYKNTPLDPSYNQVHLPGANARGTNYVVTPEAVYLVKGHECLLLNPRDGTTMQTFTLPEDPRGRARTWSYIGVYEDILLAGTEFADYTKRMEGVEYEVSRKRSAAWSPDIFGSRGLVALDRHSGVLLWERTARHSFLHNTIVAGGDRVFCLDKLPRTVEEQLARRGRSAPDTYRLMALDFRTGDVLWESSEHVFGTWLSYSDDHDILIQAGADASDRSQEEVAEGMTAICGRDGSLLWKKDDAQYAGPCILHNDLIITNSTSYDLSSGVLRLQDGSPVTIENPLTGKPAAWRYVRTYGCNTAVASEHLLTFRSGAAGYYDLTAKCGTGNLGGFRSGCTSNLIAADGVLNAPDYTRTCSCGYQNQTSLALIHMPDIETWTISTLDDIAGGAALVRLGLNLGAPGDWRDQDGLLWVEYPPVSGDAPPFHVEVDGQNVEAFRRHASAVASADLPWVASSGLRHLRRLTLNVTAQGSGAEGPADAEPAAEAAPQAYTVRLYFCEPDDVEEGQRVFDIAVQDKTVAQGWDVVREAGGRLRGVMLEFGDVIPHGNRIEIDLIPLSSATREPVLSGVAVVAQ